MAKTCDPQVAMFVTEYVTQMCGDVREARLTQAISEVQDTLEQWCEEYNAERDAYEHDPHERAAAHARANNFAATNGRDWA